MLKVTFLLHYWRAVAALFAALSLTGCVAAPEPYWIEALGRTVAVRLGAWPKGALITGTDGRLYSYPGHHSNPWVQAGPPNVTALSASNRQVYAILDDKSLVRLSGAAWVPQVSDAPWTATMVAVTKGDRIFVVSGGKVRRVSGRKLEDLACSRLPAVRSISAADDKLYVVSEKGVLYEEGPDGCQEQEGPAKWLRVAAASRRLVAIAADGSVWRRRNGERWVKLPAPLKYRPHRPAYRTSGREVAVSESATWLVDQDGSIFLLSDES